ncbi:hypothetical protein DFQ14_102230 [Halopolyspora algeriensis]|uniref:Short-subunit dehydrogenase n=1 Tax=Halopolyspora algeriensis TaxID=1500506 RepID=A0A368VVR1_9ACTN|nr:SDR family oxidoreductase [Halopolyspora algeriensis]RCW45929.1 hypothetical protein DFQ14_102230 [Halopolyspora algeriensis]TQM55342.1 hypothetical protein FHU43_0104 [Halopolyspora algeriensis]
MGTEQDQPGAGVAVITGASSGIGAVFARRLAERGYGLVLVARREQRLDELARQLRPAAAPVETIVADLADSNDRARLLERVQQQDVTVLVNNAGINGYGPFDQVDPALLGRVIDVNVTAPTLLARAALPGMLEQQRGAIVNVASLLAFAGALPPEPLPHRSTYAGTKSHMVTFSRTLAAELADTPVRVQALCPGLTATEFHLTQGEEPVTGERERTHAEGGMSAEDVVTASLVALDNGEVLCAPGLEDAQAVDRLVTVEAELRRGSVPDLAERYRKQQ